MLQEFALVVPVKPPAVGKSRLTGIDDEQRRALAQAFALDTLAVCLDVGAAGVLVSTDDATFSARCASARLCDRAGRRHQRPQLRAVAGRGRGAASLAGRRTGRPVRRPSCADGGRPACGSRPGACGHAGVRRDAEGTGTTLYTASYDRFEPRFGAMSRQAHLDTGATEIVGALPTLRRDVDDLDDLRAAIALGVGSQTRRLAHLVAVV